MRSVFKSSPFHVKNTSIFAGVKCMWTVTGSDKGSCFGLAAAGSSAYLIWQIFMLDAFPDGTPRGISVSSRDLTVDLWFVKKMCKPLHYDVIACSGYFYMSYSFKQIYLLKNSIITHFSWIQRTDMCDEKLFKWLDEYSNFPCWGVKWNESIVFWTKTIFVVLLPSNEIMKMWM